MMRVCTTDDIDWLVATAVKCYPDFVDSKQEFIEWLNKIIDNPAMVIVRGEHSAAFSVISHPFFRKTPDCELMMLFSQTSTIGANEPLRLLKYTNDLRQQRGCGKFYLNSRLADIEPFALRLGAKPAGKSYVLED